MKPYYKTRYYRSQLGDLMLTFMVFAIIGTIAVTGAIELSKFNMAKSKLSNSLQKCEDAIISDIRDNLSDSAIVGDPVNSQIVLNASRANCANAAIESLGPDFRQYLLDRGNNLSDMYDNPDTVVQINGELINIQTSVTADLTNIFPINFTKKSKPISARPSDLLRVDQPAASLDCGTCGTCGYCDLATGQCTPNYRVLVSGGTPDLGPYEEPKDDPEPDGTFECKDYEDTIQGQFCLSKGGTVIQENGQNGCDFGNGCKFISNYYAWNMVGNPFFGTAEVYWQGTKIASGISSFLTTVDFDSKTHNRGIDDGFGVFEQTPVPLALNQDDPDNIVYPVCRDDRDFVTAFVTSTFYYGDFLTQANNLIGSGQIPPVPGTHFYSLPPHLGFDAADDLCMHRACAAGMTCTRGYWHALVSAVWNHGSGPVEGVNASAIRNRLPLTGKTLKQRNGVIVNPTNNFWATTPTFGTRINVNEFGNVVNGSPNAWTGSTNNGFVKVHPFPHPSPRYNGSNMDPTLRFGGCYAFTSDGSANGSWILGNEFGFGYVGSVKGPGNILDAGFNQTCANVAKLYCVGDGFDGTVP